MIVITGANGQLGRHVIHNLLASLPARDIVAAVRSPEKAADLAELGIQVRHGDYNRPETWPAALDGASQVLLVSSSEVGVERAKQHQSVIDAAGAAGTVRRLLYTGILGNDTTSLRLAADHQATELTLRDSGLDYTVLRNGFYTEMYSGQLAHAVGSGSIVGSADPGSRLATATRAEFAEAAAAALLTDSPQRYYELSGDTAWSLAELAEEFSRQTDTRVVYQQVSPEQHRAGLLQAGLPELLADILVDVDAGIDRGDLARQDGSLSKLIGHPTAPLADAVATAVAELKANSPS